MQNRFYRFSVAFTLVLILVLSGYAQNEVGGKYITAEGILKALVVFVEFADEKDDDEYWLPGQAPNFINSFIDSDTSVNSRDYHNLTYFYDQMSLGKLNLIGDAHHIILPQTQRYYATTYNRRDIIKIALTQLDPQVDYAEYDKWSSSRDYHHFNESDGTVDMIFVIFRSANLMTWGGYHGEASLGNGSEAGYEFDGVTIKTRRGTNLGSGVTCIYKSQSPEWLAWVARHEFAHLLIGEEHPFHHSKRDRHKIWSVLDGGRIVNAYERERLDWITVPEISGNTTTVQLTDYVSTGAAVKYHPAQGGPNEYYYFENHQKTHVFDDEGLNKEDKGVYVLHIADHYDNENNIKCVTANGNYSWENPYWVTLPWGKNIPAFRQTKADRSGLNHRDAIPTTVQNYLDFIYALADDEDEYEFNAFFRGYRFTETFSLNGYYVFSPWTNPKVQTWNGTAAQFAMEVTDEHNGVLEVTFYAADPEDASPAIPINFETNTIASYPDFIWEANLEPDIAGYVIERSLEQGIWAEISTLSAEQTDYIDETLIVADSANTNIAEYRIWAFDTQGKYSNFSKIVSVQYSHVTGQVDSLVVNSEQTTSKRSFEIATKNYPNPFNSQTTIEFELDIKQHVEVRIFDITGRAVQTLHSGVLTQGIHHLNWNGKNQHGQEIASGIYLYQIKSERFVINKKMFMIK